MAYLDFRADAFEPASFGVASLAGDTTFSALEWLVIALAARDGLPSLRKPGRIASALHRLFASERESRLADPRLEALRRAAVLAWHHGYNVPKSELARFHEAGFSRDHSEMLIGNVVRRRAAGRSRRTA